MGLVTASVFWQSEARILRGTLQDILELVGPPVDGEVETMRAIRATAGHALQDLAVREGLNRRLPSEAVCMEPAPNNGVPCDQPRGHEGVHQWLWIPPQDFG